MWQHTESSLIALQVRWVAYNDGGLDINRYRNSDMRKEHVFLIEPIIGRGYGYYQWSSCGVDRATHDSAVT